MNLITFFSGKKTYVVGIIGAIINLLLVFGVFILTPEQLMAIEGLIVAVMGVTIRLGISKNGTK